MELTLEKIAQYKSLGGSIDLYWNIKKCLFLAKPKGFIHPRHIRFDLNQLRQKTNNIQTSWTYVVDTSEVIFANPLNIFYLYRIKSITGFKSFYLIAPNPVIRLLQRVFGPLLGVTAVYKTSKELDLKMDIS